MSFSESISQCGRDWTCWESVLGLMKELWWKSRCEANVGHVARFGEGERERKMSSGETKAFWLKLRVDESGFWLVWACRHETGLHLNASAEKKKKKRDPKELSCSITLLCSKTSNSQSYLDELLLWILMKENLKILPFLIPPFTALLSPVLSPSIVIFLQGFLTTVSWVTDGFQMFVVLIQEVFLKWKYEFIFNIQSKKETVYL